MKLSSAEDDGDDLLRDKCRRHPVNECAVGIRTRKLSVSPTGQSVTMPVVLPTGGPGSANR
jgi:hypothetical protein